MPDISAIGASLAAVVVVIVMLWFALGTQRNLRIGNDLLRWLQEALPLLGRRTTLRWLGSSAVELRIAEADEPFREATVTVILEPRDVVFLWAWARLRGRRDFLILRANLRSAPRFGMEAWDPRAWTGALPTTDDDWQPIEWPDPEIRARATHGADVAAVQAAWAAIDSLSTTVWRLTIQPVVPHLELHVLPPPKDVSSTRLLRPFRDLAAALTRPR